MEEICLLEALEVEEAPPESHANDPRVRKAQGDLRILGLRASQGSNRHVHAVPSLNLPSLYAPPLPR